MNKSRLVSITLLGSLGAANLAMAQQYQPLSAYDRPPTPNPVTQPRSVPLPVPQIHQPPPSQPTVQIAPNPTTGQLPGSAGGTVTFSTPIPDGTPKQPKK